MVLYFRDHASGFVKPGEVPAIEQLHEAYVRIGRGHGCSDSWMDERVALAPQQQRWNRERSPAVMKQEVRGQPADGAQATEQAEIALQVSSRARDIDRQNRVVETFRVGDED